VIDTDDLTPDEVTDVVKTALNISDTDVTSTTVDDDGSIILVVRVPSGTDLEADVIRERIEEAVVKEYGDDLDINIEVSAGGEEQQNNPAGRR